MVDGLELRATLPASHFLYPTSPNPSHLTDLQSFLTKSGITLHTHKIKVLTLMLPDELGLRAPLPLQITANHLAPHTDFHFPVLHLKVGITLHTIEKKKSLYLHCTSACLSFQILLFKASLFKASLFKCRPNLILESKIPMYPIFQLRAPHGYACI
jgi:hypothetical protein